MKGSRLVIIPESVSCLFRLAASITFPGSALLPVGAAVSLHKACWGGTVRVTVMGMCISFHILPSQSLLGPLTFLGWFLVLLLLQTTLYRIDQITCLFNVSLCLFVSIFQYRYIGEKKQSNKILDRVFWSLAYWWCSYVHFSTQMSLKLLLMSPQCIYSRGL